MKLKRIIIYFILIWTTKGWSQDLIYPADFEIISKDFEFSWMPKDLSEEYQLEVSTDLNFDNIIFDTLVFTEYFKFNISNLKNLETYYWRVRNLQSDFMWSDVGQFRTGILSKVQLLKPLENTDYNSTNKIFEIDSFIDDVYFKYQISQDSLFENILEEGFFFDNYFTTSIQLDSESKYYWRVKQLKEFTKKFYNIYIDHQIGGKVEIKDTIVEEGKLIYLEAIPDDNYFFAGWDNYGPNERIRVIVDQNLSFTPRFEKITLESLEFQSPLDTLIISEIRKLNIEGLYNNGDRIDLTNSVNIVSNSSNITKISNNEITANSSGASYIELEYKGISKQFEFYSHEIQIVNDLSMFKSKGDCQIEVPIILVNLFPTSDGINHDSKNGPLSYWGDLNDVPLEESKKKIYETLRLDRDLVEYGTRFRDYGKEISNPYACIIVEEMINVFEWKLVPWVNNRKTLDYFDLFSKLNLEKYVNNKNVKEVWITSFPIDAYPGVVNSSHNDPDKYWGMPESNMSSPTTGDISNSYRIPDDLPIYDKTYVVYGNNGHRGTDTDIHNRGHQIEAQLSYLDIEPEEKKLFWNNFVGVKGGDQSNNGRCGNTHFPPNAENDYDYCNSAFIQSDIQNWTPGGGTKEPVNCSTWLDIKYPINFKVQNLGYVADYDIDPHTKWLFFWFQSIPGFENEISFQKNGVQKKISNWWDLFFNWDESIKNNKKLYQE